MSDYIERDKAFNAILNLVPKVDDDGYCWVIRGDAATAIDSIPAADVRPVVRGKWKPRDLTWGRSYYYCSACEETVDMPTAMGIPIFRYCPNCGADMREES